MIYMVKTDTILVIFGTLVLLYLKYNKGQLLTCTLSSLPASETWQSTTYEGASIQQLIAMLLGYQSPFSANNGVNGKSVSGAISGACAQTKSQVNPWWQAKLDDKYYVTAVQIIAPATCDTCPEGFKFENILVEIGEVFLDYTTEGWIEEWNAGKQNCSFFSTAVDDLRVVVNCSKPLFGNFVRLTKLSTEEATLSVCEVDVIGYQNCTVNPSGSSKFGPTSSADSGYITSSVNVLYTAHVAPSASATIRPSTSSAFSTSFRTGDSRMLQKFVSSDLSNLEYSTLSSDNVQLITSVSLLPGVSTSGISSSPVFEKMSSTFNYNQQSHTYTFILKSTDTVTSTLQPSFSEIRSASSGTSSQSFVSSHILTTDFSTSAEYLEPMTLSDIVKDTLGSLTKAVSSTSKAHVSASPSSIVLTSSLLQGLWSQLQPTSSNQLSYSISSTFSMPTLSSISSTVSVPTLSLISSRRVSVPTLSSISSTFSMPTLSSIYEKVLMPALSPISVTVSVPTMSSLSTTVPMPTLSSISSTVFMPTMSSTSSTVSKPLLSSISSSGSMPTLSSISSPVSKQTFSSIYTKVFMPTMSSISTTGSMPKQSSISTTVSVPTLSSIFSTVAIPTLSPISSTVPMPTLFSIFSTVSMLTPFSISPTVSKPALTSLSVRFPSSDYTISSRNLYPSFPVTTALKSLTSTPALALWISSRFGMSPTSHHSSTMSAPEMTSILGEPATSIGMHVSSSVHVQFHPSTTAVFSTLRETSSLVTKMSLLSKSTVFYAHVSSTPLISSSSVIVPQQSSVIPVWCPCTCEQAKLITSLTSSNKTTEQITEEIEEALTELTVDSKTTTVNERKLVSADDKRGSAKLVGTVGVVFCATIIVLIILSDLPMMIVGIKRVLER